MHPSSLPYKTSKPLLTKLGVSETSNANANAKTLITPGNSTTIKRNDNTYNLNNRNNSACSMNSTKQLINNEILKKKYSMPSSKETPLSHLLTKNLHLHQINNRFPGALSQRLLKKTEDLKIIDDIYKLSKPELLCSKDKSGPALQNPQNNSSSLLSTDKKKPPTLLDKERKNSHDGSKDKGTSLQKSSHFQNMPQISHNAELCKHVSQKHLELNNLIRVLQQTNHDLATVKPQKSEFQQKIQQIKEKLESRSKEMTSKSKDSHQKPDSGKRLGFFSHRGAVPKYMKEDEYFTDKRLDKEEKPLHQEPLYHNKKLLEPNNEQVELYLLTNEGEHSKNRISIKRPKEANKKPSQHNSKPENNPNNSRSLNESDLEKLLNNPNIQLSNKRLDFGLVASKKGNDRPVLDEKTAYFISRKLSLDDRKNSVTNALEEKAKKIGNCEILKHDLNVLKERISSTLGKYQAKSEKLKEINAFLYNKIKRDAIV